MKSTKKRFKSRLVDVRQTAVELGSLSSGLVLLEDVSHLAQSVLVLCDALRARASELSKVDFAEQMLADASMIELDGVVDCDVISVLEQRLSDAWPAGLDAGSIGELLAQLLDKIEKRHAAMIENIQRLSALLAPPDQCPR